MNINPEEWGRFAWDTIFYFCVFYKENNLESQKIMIKFIYLLRYLLPCNSCKKNYEKNIRNFNIKTVSISKEHLIDFFIYIKTEVAAMNGKKIDITFNDIINKYYITEGGDIPYDLWSESFWNTIFYFSVVYPESPLKVDKLNMTEFIYLIGNLLPSNKYQTIYKKELNFYNINNVVENRKNLVQFFINIRKKFENRYNLTYTEIEEKYLYNKKRLQLEYIILIIFIILFILLIIFYLLRNFI